MPNTTNNTELTPSATSGPILGSPAQLSSLSPSREPSECDDWAHVDRAITELNSRIQIGYLPSGQGQSPESEQVARWRSRPIYWLHYHIMGGAS